MKKNIKALLATVMAFGLAACTYDPYKTDIPAVEYNLELTSSVTSFELTEENVNDFRLSFSWTPARNMPDGYLVTYTTELDVVGNNFGSKTVIVNTEEDGVYERTFTGTQLNNWIVERWNLPKNTAFKLEFRVVASISGPTFEVPEVGRVAVDGKPIPVIIFDADKMSLAGSAMAEETEIFKTLENENQYAWVGDFTAGELSIPVVLDGATQYIVPADGNGDAILDGQAEDVAMALEPKSWKITEAGKYRVVVNMADKKVTIYSPKTDLKPLVVEWYPNDDTANWTKITTEVTKLWGIGNPHWSSKELDCVQSLADPQIFIVTLPDKDWDKMRFNIVAGGKHDDELIEGKKWDHNNAYCFAGGDQKKTTSVTVGKTMDLYSGASGAYKESYFTFSKNKYRVILNLREMTILWETIE